jgi:hypothetical protein
MISVTTLYRRRRAQEIKIARSGARPIISLGGVAEDELCRRAA